jgi:hypothetical protein
MTTSTNILKITAIDQAGPCKTGTVNISYQDLIDTIGFPENVQDDPDKVEASWGFKDQHNRKAFVWCYKIGKHKCFGWSTTGDKNLLRDLFGDRFQG